MNDYIVYQSEHIVKNQGDILEDINIAKRLFDKIFPDRDTTWSYDRYNVFSLTAPSTNFYEIFKEIRTIVRQQLGDEQPLWCQAWLNYHTQDQLLKKHAHEFEFHGYVCLDPKNTKTVFDGYEIVNKTGQIYFGPGYRNHWVEAIEPFDGIRTTIGFDIFSLPSQPSWVKSIDRPYSNIGIIPL
jgi:hypothetical protein